MPEQLIRIYTKDTGGNLHDAKEDFPVSDEQGGSGTALGSLS